jgi:membrane-bound lytic murein transglycosylase A
MHTSSSKSSRFWPILAILASVLAIVSTSFAVWCYQREQARLADVDELPAEPLEDRLILQPGDWSDLPGWSSDDLAKAIPALRRSCEVFALRDPGAEIGADAVGGRVSDWLDPCESFAEAQAGEPLRTLIEQEFTPVQILNNEEEQGLFTGYYEPSLRGSRARSETYRVPLLKKPADLITVDLEPFHDRFAGSRISGRIAEETFKPYYERDEITAGALDPQGLELVWVDDPVDAFFLHIQGSGRIGLEDGSEMRVGYAGQNGRPYYAIGRELVERGYLVLEDVSMQSIRSWLSEHPEEAEEVMATNRSYVFFRELEGDGPVGTMGVALTPGRSLAVDRKFLPLGVPVWLDGLAPEPFSEGELPLQRLLVTQDTGGAIKGPVRGDVFWGHGPEAEEVAGRMKHQGRLWILLPDDVAARLSNEP